MLILVPDMHILDLSDHTGTGDTPGAGPELEELFQQVSLEDPGVVILSQGHPCEEREV